MIPTLEWTADGVRFLDQTRLPLEETYVLATTSDQVANVITTMVVRGAPGDRRCRRHGRRPGYQEQLRHHDSGADQRTGKHLQDTGRHPPHGGQSLLGHRTHAPPFLRARRPARHHHRRHSGRTDRRSPHHVRRGHRRLPHHGRLRRTADARLGWSADPLQRRGPCLLRLRHGAGRDPRCRRTRPPDCTSTPTKRGRSCRARASPPGR